ncbi:ankyrin repeat domain-containing protein 30A-like [Senna tora]|uniref:Ankyrin repeat domain-containing protein 30A-like n=1 Tax=Senna tora TaxID=362788 RepID=A0A834SKQ7_9FABA|nr:ankyrin repeat domain-containing protein 30A-like [Senna tora]
MEFHMCMRIEESDKKCEKKEEATWGPCEWRMSEQSEQHNQLVAHNSGSLSFSSHLSKEDEEMSRSALSTFKAKEEEIERKKLQVREKVQAQLGRVEEETKRLALIREEHQELETLADPMRKEVALVRKKIDSINKELKPLGSTCQKKEKEYKEALEAFNEKNREKVQLITKLMELVSESEKLRMKKLEELSKNIESMN